MTTSRLERVTAWKSANCRPPHGALGLLPPFFVASFNGAPWQALRPCRTSQRVAFWAVPTPNHPHLPQRHRTPCKNHKPPAASSPAMRRLLPLRRGLLLTEAPSRVGATRGSLVCFAFNSGSPRVERDGGNRRQSGAFNRVALSFRFLPNFVALSSSGEPPFALDRLRRLCRISPQLLDHRWRPWKLGLT